MTSDVYLTVSSLLRAVDRQRLYNQGKARGRHHSFLPNKYWGSVTHDVKFPKLGHFAFSRGNVEAGRFSLPNFSKDSGRNTIPKHPDITKHRGTTPSHDLDESVNQNEKQPGLSGHSNRFLPKSNKKTGKVILGVTKDKYHEGSNGKLPFLTSMLGSTEQTSDSHSQRGGLNVRQKVTVHVPDQDGKLGRIALHRTTADGEVLPPLISIHSPMSRMHDPYDDDDSHFTYHHLQEDERPNLPRYDSNLSAALGGVSRAPTNMSLQGLRDSPAFHITSVSNNNVRQDWLHPDSPIARLHSDGCLYCGELDGIHKDFCKAASGKITKQTMIINSSPTSRLNSTIKQGESGSDRDTSLELLNKKGRQTDSQTRNTNSSPMTETESSSISYHSSTLGNGLDTINTVIEDLPSDQSFTDEAFLNKAFREGQERKKVKVPPVSEVAGSEINIHRRAYIAALAVARSRQLPDEPTFLQFRVSKPYQFSYFGHVPHQKPCRCAECREIAISKTISPRKGAKLKKFSPMKHIFGNVKIEDYYPKQHIS